MSLNMVAETTLYLHGLIIVQTDPTDGDLARFSHEIDTGSPEAKLGTVPIEAIVLNTDDNAWLALVTERAVSRMVDKTGTVRNYHARDILRGLVSQEYNPDSMEHTFVSAEVLLDDPAAMTERAEQSLSILADAPRVILGSYHLPALTQLLRQYAILGRISGPE